MEFLIYIMIMYLLIGAFLGIRVVITDLSNKLYVDITSDVLGTFCLMLFLWPLDLYIGSYLPLRK